MATLNPTPLAVVQNAGKSWSFVFKDNTGTPINMTGFTFAGGYTSQMGKALIGDFTFDSTHVSTGKLVVSVVDGWSDADQLTITVPKRALQYQLNITDTQGKTITIYGPFVVLRSSL